MGGTKGQFAQIYGVEWKKVTFTPPSEVSFDGLIFLVEVTSEGKELLNRSISGYPLLENLLINLLNDAEMLPSHVKSATESRTQTHSS